MDSHRTTADAEIVWEPCGSCWGQRVIWRRDPEGGRLRSCACDTCLGVGARGVVVAGRRSVPTRS